MSANGLWYFPEENIFDKKVSDFSCNLALAYIVMQKIYEENEKMKSRYIELGCDGDRVYEIPELLVIDPQVKPFNQEEFPLAEEPDCKEIFKTTLLIVLVTSFLVIFFSLLFQLIH